MANLNKCGWALAPVRGGGSTRQHLGAAGASARHVGVTLRAVATNATSRRASQPQAGTDLKLSSHALQQQQQQLPSPAHRRHEVKEGSVFLGGVQWGCMLFGED